MPPAKPTSETPSDRREPSDALEALYKQVGIAAVFAAADYVKRSEKPVTRPTKQAGR